MSEGFTIKTLSIDITAATILREAVLKLADTIRSESREENVGNSTFVVYHKC